jgi:DNA-directed RNA polymerase beta subunit
VSIATPVFDGAVEADINVMLEQAGLNVRDSRRSMTGVPVKPSTVR